MISLQNIGYDINGEKLFDNISMSILPTAIVKIVGRNGAGKTTFLRILAGVHEPTSGFILHDEEEIAYIGHNIGVKDDFTVLEHLIFWAELIKNEILIPAAIKYLRLDDILEDYCYTLSVGNRKKVAMARLILSGAMIWILDELDASLDENNIEILKNLIMSKVQNGGIVIYSSHRNILPHSFTIEIGS